MGGIPVESAECDGCLSDIADVSEADTAAKENGESDEACKPESHRHGIRGEKCKTVIRDRRELVQSCKAKVDCRNEREDTGEEEEVDLNWRHVAPIVGPPVGDCSCC